MTPSTPCTWQEVPDGNPKTSKALAERDRRCVWPGCDRPPEWSQRHHELPWALGGRTEIDGMTLLCKPHPGRLSRGWRLERLPDRRMTSWASFCYGSVMS